jgi:CO/xanthine dehydrogenase Mo-binding subunit
MSVDRNFVNVGKPTVKKDVLPKAMGAAKYLQDLSQPLMLHGAILRSGISRAKIVSIDTSKALAAPGVRAVLTGADSADVIFGFGKDNSPLKKDLVRCHFDEVAAVAADTEEQARAACKLIEVQYEELPGVFTAADSLAEGAPVLHEGRRNLFTKYDYEHGNVEEGFAACDEVIEMDIQLPRHSPGQMAPSGCMAAWDHEGRLTVWTPNQVPFLMAKDFADAFKIPGSKVRVIQPTIGGSFGKGLDTHTLDMITVLLARETGRPVKITNTRQEELRVCTTRQPSVVKSRMGVTRQGKILAVEVDYLCDIGAYVSWGVGTPVVKLETIASLYRIPNAKMRARMVYTNNPYSGAIRGYGNPQSTFILESMLDELAERLGMDKVAIRLLNANDPDTETPQGLKISSCGHKDCLSKAAEAIGWGRELPPNHGIGIASTINVGGGARIYRSDGCGSIVKVDDFGKVTLISGTTEIGQGSETAMALIVAEELGVLHEDVSVINTDTDVKPWDVGCHASRTTFIGGNSALLAAREAKTKILDFAAGLLEAPAEELDIRDRMVFVKADPDKAVPISTCVRKMHFRPGGSGVVGEAFYDPPNQMMDRRYYGNISVTYGFGAQAAEVKVDPDTGEITVIKLVAVHDAGQVINPLAATGQIEGGAAMGLGYGLTEELLLDHGKLLNTTFLDYRMPTTLEMPETEVHFVDTYDPQGPFGAKGIGEMGLVPTMSALANAVKQAAGVRMTRLPMTRERVYRAMKGIGDPD